MTQPISKIPIYSKAQVEELLAEQSAATDSVIAGLAAPGFPLGVQVDGDSTAAGAGDTVTPKQWEVLADNLGLIYHQAGVSGQTTSEIALRLGAFDPVLTFAGNSLVTGTSAQTATLTSTGSWKTSAYTWAGALTNTDGDTVTGTLAHDATGLAWTFTRDSVGSAAFDCTGGVAFHCTENDATRDYFHVLIGGTNNTETDPALSIAVRDFDLMARYCRNGYVIVSLHQRPSEGFFVAKAAFNALMLTRFGNRWVDVNAYTLLNGLALAGITPTSADLSAVQAGTMPPSLMSDNTHPNTAGYTVWRRAVEHQIRTRGFATFGLIPSALLAAPTVTVGAPTATTLPITWTAVTGAVGYRVRYRKTGTTAWVQGPNATGASTTVVDPVSNDLVNGTQYDIDITAVNDAGFGTPSAVATGTTTGAPPTVITSDSFGTGSGNINTTSTDATLGGSALTWTTNNANSTRTSAKLRQTTSQATLETSSNNHRVSVVLSSRAAAGNQSVALRYTDASNLYSVQVMSTGQVRINKTVGGTTTTGIAQTPVGQAVALSGDKLEARVVGSTITAYLNGAAVLSVTDTSLATGTKVQLVSTTGPTEWDDLIVYDK